MISHRPPADSTTLFSAVKPEFPWSCFELNKPYFHSIYDLDDTRYSCVARKTTPTMHSAHHSKMTDTFLPRISGKDFKSFRTGLKCLRKCLDGPNPTGTAGCKVVVSPGYARPEGNQSQKSTTLGINVNFWRNPADLRNSAIELTFDRPRSRLKWRSRQGCGEVRLAHAAGGAGRN